MTDREIIATELQYTEHEASGAFEWLRSKALSGDYGSRSAAIMLAEVARLKERERYVQGEDSKNAARYAFIRDPKNARGDGDGSSICKMWDVIISVNSTPEQMDAAIDAAMSACISSSGVSE